MNYITKLLKHEPNLKKKIFEVKFILVEFFRN